MTPPNIYDRLTVALGNLLTLIENRVNEELSPQEKQVFDEAAELYAEVKHHPTIQAAVKKGARRAS